MVLIECHTNIVRIDFSELSTFIFEFTNMGRHKRSPNARDKLIINCGPGWSFTLEDLKTSQRDQLLATMKTIKSQIDSLNQIAQVGSPKSAMALPEITIPPLRTTHHLTDYHFDGVLLSCNEPTNMMSISNLLC